MKRDVTLIVGPKLLTSIVRLCHTLKVRAISLPTIYMSGYFLKLYIYLSISYIHLLNLFIVILRSWRKPKALGFGVLMFGKRLKLLVTRMHIIYGIGASTHSTKQHTSAGSTGRARGGGKSLHRNLAVDSLSDYIVDQCMVLVVTGVMKQRLYGLCWFFVPTGAVEAINTIASTCNR